MAVNCIILDDEPLALDLIEDYVKRTPFLNLCAKCNSAVEALEAARVQKIDIAFLDIQMPLINGLELSRMLSGCAIIFTTAFEKYAVEGYKVNAIGYLLKPFSYAEFLAAANRGWEWVQMRRKAEGAGDGAAGASDSGDGLGFGGASGSETASDRVPTSIVVRSEYRQRVIELSSIIYIESLRDYQKFHLDGGESVLTQMSLKSVEEMLPPADFVRVHRSFVVNIRKVKIIERSRIVFGSDRIPISDSYRAEFEKRLK